MRVPLAMAAVAALVVASAWSGAASNTPMHQALGIAHAWGTMPVDATRLQGPVLEGATYWGVHAAPATPGAVPDAADAILDLYAALGLPIRPEEAALLRQHVAALDSDLDHGLRILLHGLLAAQQHASRAYAALSPEDQAHAQACLIAWAHREACADPARAAASFQAIDRRELTHATLALAAASEAAIPIVQGATTRLQLSHSHLASAILFSDPHGLVSIGAWGSQTSTGSMPMLSLDLGGDDHYQLDPSTVQPRTQVGPCFLWGSLPDHPDVQCLVFCPLGGCDSRRVMLALDLGGNDAYTGQKGPALGEWGVSLLVEVGGDDTYNAFKLAQGSGWAGVGILLELEGNDQYTSNWKSQGATATGLGLLFDAFGDDVYSGQMEVQGAGSAGPGMLIDRQGMDTYRAITDGVSFGGAPISQASVFTIGELQTGSTALLLDLDGADTYEVRSSSGGASGSRGFIGPNPGFAFFIDPAGSDTYLGSPGGNNQQWLSPRLVLGLGYDRN